MKPCPACGSTTNGKQEPGEYALLELRQGKLILDTTAANNPAVVVTATVCGDCGYVALYDVG
jgi:hypothetical protein